MSKCLCVKTGDYYYREDFKKKRIKEIHFELDLLSIFNLSFFKYDYTIIPIKKI